MHAHMRPVVPPVGPPCWGPLLCSVCLDSIFLHHSHTCFTRGPPSSPPQPLSPRAGLPTTGRRAPFPPPARHTSGQTAAGTSTHLGKAEDGEERGQGMLADLSGRGQAANPGERKQGAEREAGRWEKVEAGGTGN